MWTRESKEIQGNPTLIIGGFPAKQPLPKKTQISRPDQHRTPTAKKEPNLSFQKQSALGLESHSLVIMMVMMVMIVVVIIMMMMVVVVMMMIVMMVIFGHDHRLFFRHVGGGSLILSA